MRKVLKWTGIVIGSLLVLVVLAGVGLNFSARARLNKSYDIQPEAVNIPTDAVSIEEGERLASFYCTGCHGTNLEGKEFFNDPALAVVDAPNLTSGAGGVGASYTDSDWVRAIRHGVDPDGKPLFIMPANDFYYLSDEDLGQLIAFIKTTTPVDNDSNRKSHGFVGSILMAMGVFGDVLPAETIPHTATRPDAPAAAINADFGNYLVTTFGCRTCHGAELSGGANPEPGAPPGVNLTPGGALSEWSEADFIHNIRTRSSEYMPYESLAKMSDDELTAIWLYLQSLPALETTTK